MVAGSSRCLNNECVAVRHGLTVQNRDAVSSFLIGLSGLTYCLSKQLLPCLDRSRVSTVFH
jgi:hypothetical protein